MARTSDLNDFLTDVANSIRTKKGYSSSQKIVANTFDTEILSISTVNNQNKTISENGIYTADQGYTGLGQVTVDVESMPDGIFAQSDQPTKTTNEAIWLKQINSSKASTKIDSSTSIGYTENSTVSTTHRVNWIWGDVLSLLTTEQVNAFDSYSKHIILQETNNYSAYLHLIASNDMTKPNANGITSSGETYIITFANDTNNVKRISRETTVIGYTVSTYIKKFAWETIYTDSSATVIGYESDVADIETGIQIDVDNDTSYLIYTNKVSTWNKILDTSDADAAASNILFGKTAFVNNQKITGTMPNNGALAITPSTSQQTISAGYTSGGTVSAVTSDIDQNIIAGNIKSGVTILGVTGNYSGDEVIIDGTIKLSQSSFATFPNWLANATYTGDMSYKFNNNISLLSVPSLNTDTITNTEGMFTSCTSLASVGLFDTGDATNTKDMFSYCTSLETVPQFDFSSSTNINQLFKDCTLLQNVPVLDFSSVTNYNSGVFENCPNLSNTSLNNILASCLTMTGASSSRKKLNRIGLSSAQATTCTTLSNWAACQAAGWTTGY